MLAFRFGGPLLLTFGLLSPWEREDPGTHVGLRKGPVVAEELSLEEGRRHREDLFVGEEVALVGHHNEIAELGVIEERAVSVDLAVVGLMGVQGARQVDRGLGAVVLLV